MISAIARKTDRVRYYFEKILYDLSCSSGELSKYKGMFEGSPMLIVGNGPSLNITPLDDFCSIPSIGMNKINLIFGRVEWRPNFIFCLNRHVLRQNQEFYFETNIPCVISWQARWFLKSAYRKSMHFFYNNFTREFSTDITSGFGIGGTVTYSALQFAYYLGCDPVILVGVDHSFASKGPANKLVVGASDDENHFDKNYFGKGIKWNLPDLEESERAYLNAKMAFEKDGRKVYDATINGKLNVFEKISIDNAINIAKSCFS